MNPEFTTLWDTLNQVERQNSVQIFETMATVNAKLAKQHFQNISQYKFINLTSLRKEDKQLIQKAGWSFKYLQSNLVNLISEDGVVSENLSDAERQVKLQQSMVQEGYLYALCPKTGATLRSNRSLFLTSRWCFYRFEGKEVFYIISESIVTYLYFPQQECIFHFKVAKVRLKIVESIITNFKSYVVTNAKKILSYLIASDSQVKTVGVVGLNKNSTAHHIWDDLPGIQNLYEAGQLNSIDQLLIPIGCEYYGGIDEIFPELSSEKVKRVEFVDLGKNILENNFFGCMLRTGAGCRFVKENLAQRIYKLSEQKCSPDFISQVKEAKAKSFPILWVSFRLGKRTWMSQFKGITNIIENLSLHFPKLGVIFDGYSRRDIWGSLELEPQEENYIANEKKFLNEIKSCLPKTVNIYDVIGAPMYEAIIWAHNIDLYMAPLGGGLVKVVSIANKPGIVHGNKLFAKTRGLLYSKNRENSTQSICIPEELIVDAEDDMFTEVNPINRSYDCDWKIIYQEVLKLVSKLAN